MRRRTRRSCGSPIRTNERAPRPRLEPGTATGEDAKLLEEHGAPATFCRGVVRYGPTRLVGNFYGRFIRRARIRGGASHVVDLHAAAALAPAARTTGGAFPGCRSGWFRLRNGEKSLLYVTDQRRVAYVRTRLGFSVLLSVTEPDALVSALRTVAPGS